MAKQRLTRKEIRQPDQLISFGVQMAEWVTRHVKPLIYSGVGLLVVLGVLLGWSSWRNRQHQYAERMLYDAEKLLKAVENPSDASASSQAVASLQTLIRTYPHTAAAALAHWHLGHTYFAQKEYANALRAYQHARERAPHDSKSLLPVLITMNIAAAHEATQACAEAIANFEVVVQSAARWLHEAAYLGMGRCYESQGALDKALATYERALTEDLSDGGRRTLEERIRLLSPQKRANK